MSERRLIRSAHRKNTGMLKKTLIGVILFDQSVFAGADILKTV